MQLYMLQTYHICLSDFLEWASREILLRSIDFFMLQIEMIAADPIFATMKASS